MAKFRFTDHSSAGIDMTESEVVFGRVTARSTSTLRFTDDDHTITYTGEFTSRNGRFFGTLDSLTEIDGGVTLQTATDLNKDASVFWNYFQRAEPVDALNYLISADDSIRGAAFGDHLLGGGGRDSIRGRGGKDTIEGGAGADRLRGDGGKDRLDGGGGKDKLYGGGGGDRLKGGSGDDVLFGGAGRDVLFGSNGADRFVFAEPGDFAGKKRPDVIRDFDRSEGDKIDLRPLDANTFAKGGQAFQFIGDQGFSETPGELRFKNGVVMGDVQGDGKADFHIAVDAALLLASDFLL